MSILDKKPATHPMADSSVPLPSDTKNSAASFLLTHKHYASANTLAAVYETTPSTIWRWAASGRIPQPEKLAPGTTRWDMEAVEAALAKAAAAANGGK